MKRLMLVVFWGLAVALSGAGEPEHPYMIWTKQEAKELRARILSRPWARDNFVARFQKATNAWERSTIDNIFLYTMTGDRDAAQAEMKALLGFINAPPLLKDMTDWRWHRVDHYDMAIRFDVFYNEITAGQRKALIETFRNLAVFGIEKEPLRGMENPRMLSHMFSALATGDKRLIRGIFECRGGMKEFFDNMKDGRFSPGGNNPSHRSIGEVFLWCRAVERLGMNELGFGYKGAGGDLRSYLEGMAALGDPRVDIPGGMPFYGRSALSTTLNVGSQNGIPMDRFPPEVFRAPIVIGHLRTGEGGWNEWHITTTGKDYNEYEQGSFRMQLALVFELASQRWPDGPFAYFLAQMRQPGTDTYAPSIYWGLDPIPAAAVKPPDARSAIYQSSGVAMLRSNEGPGFWESPSPSAVLRLIAPVPGDSLTRPSPGRDTERMASLHAPPSDRYTGMGRALLGMHAFNRPMYRMFTPDRETGWYRSPKAHATVVVDNALQGRAVAAIRNRFDRAVKFIGVRTIPVSYTEKDDDGQDVERVAELHPGVMMERCLALTGEYMFDAFAVASGEQHTYDWLVHPIGTAEPDEPENWKPTSALDATLADTARGLPFNFGDQRVMNADGSNWSLSVVQTAFTTNVAGTTMGPEWYGRRVGVRVSMLGEPGTKVFHARKPLARRLTQEETETVERERNPLKLRDRSAKYDKVDKDVVELEVLPADATAVKPGDARRQEAKKPPFKPVGVPGETVPETGGVTIVAERHAASTLFAAIHEPFAQGRWHVTEFRRIAQTADAVAAVVKGDAGSPVNDRLLLRFGENAGQPATVEGGGEVFTFSDFVHVRVGPDRVSVSGPLLAMKLKVAGSPKVFVNGEEMKAKVSGGVLVF